ncbi:uncharacterized protein LTR77_003874 [Saxophila tyrrhenica]|uniref:PWI domain-containing protein n=1 Tax=Saxophila tyrrhenica TaxID=1690608 RepID=A0AAV9PF36_9PEZI|nr:hypothetical protein LTR77_003874 [Saxophila tyrrhenica]
MSAALTTNVDQRLLRTTKFPPEFNTKVNLAKVNVQLIKAWVGDEVARILKSEDDVVTELVNNILDSSKHPNIKELQIQLTGFLDKDAAPFCQALWKLCLSAQDSPHGVPKELLEAKKAELAQAKADEDKAREDALKRQEADRERERDVARVRDRERSERGRGRGGRGGRDFDRRAPRDSRSPPPRRRHDDDDYRRPPPRATDSYIPSNPRRRGSPSYSRSPSPPRRRRRDPSRSRSPPRRSRNTSTERSRSRDRGSDRRRKRSSALRRRSPSPRRHRRRSPSSSDRSRSPPAKRNRRDSPSAARPSTSDSAPSHPSPAAKKKKDTALASNDLMSTNRRKESFRKEAGRLSREPSASTSPSVTPQTDTEKTKAGAQVGNDS